jgi:hypothetical protein
MASIQDMTIKIKLDSSEFDRLMNAHIQNQEGEIMPRKKKVDPFKKGRTVAKKSGGGGKFINIPPDESLVLAPMVGLDEMVSADMHQHWNLTPPVYHPCIGADCPGCAVGNEARFKGFLPVIVKGEDEPSIYSFTISVYNQLETIEDSLDDGESLAGMALKIVRKGSGLKTRYTVIATGKRVSFDVEVPEFISSLGATDSDSIWEQLEESGEYDREDYITTPKKRKAEKVVEESDDEEEDDDWGEV